MIDPDWFGATDDAIAIAAMLRRTTGKGDGQPAGKVPALPDTLPATGVGTEGALRALAPLVLGGARALGALDALAHMDPPTAAAAQAATWWNATLNQNLLHPDTAPVAREIEARVIDWLAPFFGMDGGHMLPGSTIANLTALWAARDLRGVRHVVASEAAHLSIAKAAHLLGLSFRTVGVDNAGALDPAALPSDLDQTCLVLTAGTTSAGAIDPLTGDHRAAWLHVDAAWAGPMRLCPGLSSRLDGIERADSVAVSAHKWLFQPKESALVLWRDTARAHRALAFGGAYLAVPNVGLLGSHGAVAVPLMATLMAWGQEGVATVIATAMDAADRLEAGLRAMPGVTVHAPNRTGVLAWRLADDETTARLHAGLPAGSTSTTRFGGRLWCRNVAANPLACEQILLGAVGRGLDAVGRGRAGS